MGSNSSRQSQAWSLYGAIGIALFAVGVSVLEDAMGGDVLTFLGGLCIAAGLVGIVAGGVALGTRSQGNG